MPPRQYTGNVPYSELDQRTLRQIQDTTASFPEFLRVNRLLFMPKGAILEDFSNKIKAETGIDISRSLINSYEIGHPATGSAFPNTQSQKALFDSLFSDNDDLKNRAKTLLNGNRARLAFQAYQKGDYITAGSRLQFISPEYFTEQLQSCHERAGHARQMDRPKWIEEDSLIPIERDYQYLHALRKALGLAHQHVADANGYSYEAISGSETYSQLGIRQNMSETKVKLFAYYEQIAQERGLESLINRKVFESLPNGPLKGHRKHAARKSPESSGVEGR